MHPRSISLGLLSGGFIVLTSLITPVGAVSEFLPHAQTLSSLGVINTQSSEVGYRLSSTISRGEAVKLSLGTAGLGQKDCRTLSVFSFTDVNVSLGSLCGYIEGAVENNIISPASRFYPNMPITRGDFADVIVKSFEVSSPSLIGNPAAGVVYYTDVSTSLPTATSINRLATTGCINTTLTSFRPYASITRGEAFKIMSCLVGKKNGINTSTTTTNQQTTNNNSTTSTTQQQTNTSTQSPNTQTTQGSQSTTSSTTTNPSSSASYAWSTTSYGSCSKTCGGGVQSRTISCKKTTDNSVVADSFCIATGITKPVSQKLCNTMSCGGNNTSASSGGASSICGYTTGKRTILPSNIPGGGYLVQDSVLCSSGVPSPLTESGIYLQWTCANETIKSVIANCSAFNWSKVDYMGIYSSEDLPYVAGGWFEGGLGIKFGGQMIIGFNVTNPDVRGIYIDFGSSASQAIARGEFCFSKKLGAVYGDSECESQWKASVSYSLLSNGSVSSGVEKDRASHEFPVNTTGTYYLTVVNPNGGGAQPLIKTIKEVFKSNSPSTQSITSATAENKCPPLDKNTTIREFTTFNTPGSTTKTDVIQPGKSLALSFVSSSTMFPQGARISGGETTSEGGSELMDVVLSPCAGVFTSENPRCMQLKKNYSSITTFPTDIAGGCTVIPNQQYYLNIRPFREYPASKIFGTQRN